MKTEMEVNRALLDYKREQGPHDKMRDLMLSVAGVGVMSEIPPEKREAVIAACESGEVFDGELPKASPKLDWPSVGAKAWANYNRRGTNHG